MKKLIIIFICLACLIVVEFGIQMKPVMASGNIYYVAKTGNDKNNGSFANPWLTISKAAATAVAGDTVKVESGTYNEWVIIESHSGTASDPITFEAYPGDSPIIDGTGLSQPAWDQGLVMINQSYIKFEGFVVENNPYFDGVYDYNGSNIILENLTIHDCEECGIKLQGTEAGYVTVESCKIYNVNENGYNESISLMPCSNVEIENCYIHDTSKDGMCIKDGSSNISIHNNEIFDANHAGIYIDSGTDGDTGVTGESNITIYDNKIHGILSGPGIALGSEIVPEPLTGLSIYNNLIYDNDTGFAVWPYSFDKSFNLINNTFYQDGAEITISDSQIYNINCVIRNNIIDNSTSLSWGIEYSYYSDGGISVDHNLFYNSGGSWISDNIFGTSYVTGNPLLINPTTNFNISSNSPAIGVGSGILAPSADYIGTSRPQEAAYDIGAYEYVPLSILTTTLPNWTVGMAYSQTLTLVGGTAPFSWTITSGSLPSGLSLSSSGVISGTPTTAEGTTFVSFQVTDSTSAIATASLSITINTPPSIVTSALPNGTVGMVYSQTLTLVGGTAPFSWTITSGSLPSGLSLSSSGVISGTPTTAEGTTFVSFQVTDSTSAIATASLSITINTPPSIVTSALPNGTVGMAYSQTLTLVGGTAPFNWTITSGSLPSGLSLSSSGVISGTPTTAEGPISVTLQVTDSTSAIGIKYLSITINSTPLISNVIWRQIGIFMIVVIVIFLILFYRKLQNKGQCIP